MGTMVSTVLSQAPIPTIDRLKLLVAAIGFSLVLKALHIILVNIASPIRGFPGPFIARFTDLWRLLDYYNGTQIQTQGKLHEELGCAVRIGPNMISLSDPAMLKIVYSTTGGFPKSDFYSVNDAIQDGNRIENIFSTRDKRFHKTYVQPIKKLFSLQQTLAFEHLFDKTITLLCSQLEARFCKDEQADTICDLADWIEYFCWDVDSEVTFSQDMGLLRAGGDPTGIIRKAELCQRYFGIVGQMPWLDKWLAKNSRCPIRFPSFSDAADYCVQRIAERQSMPRHNLSKDFLDHYIDAQKLYPEIVGNNEVTGYLLLNVLAGADTTAIVTKTIIYNVLLNHDVYARLRNELDAASLSFPATYKQTQNLTYLDAVVREGKRIHPVIGGILERVIPDDGLTLPDGRYIPGGVRVGMNPWILHRNKAIYGQDVDKFCPDRWLRSDEESPETYATRLKHMKDTDLTFGAGSRACIGRNFANVEIFKIIATLFYCYDMELAVGAKQWTTRWWWFTFVDHIHVKLQRRENLLR